MRPMTTAAALTSRLSYSANGCGLSMLRSGQEDEVEEAAQHQDLQRVIDEAVPVLEARRMRAHAVEEAEDPVQHADFLARLVRGRCSSDEGAPDEAVGCSRDAGVQWSLDVAEEDDARRLRRVFRPVNEGLVEQDGLAVAPGIHLAVHVDTAVVRVRRD